MSLYFVCGKPGAGKSYRGLVRIAEQLVNDTRTIVTNLSIDLGRLDEYLRAKYPTKEINLSGFWRPCLESDAGNSLTRSEDGLRVWEPGRVRFLEPKQLAEFYRFRQEDAPEVVRLKPAKAERDPVLLDFTPWAKGGKYVNRGVIYHLDEVQLFYNCRKFAESPDEMPFYLSQHRKLGDDIYAYTQQPGNVDKMFRSFTQEYIYLTNLSKKKLGIFALPKCFRFAAYSDLYTGAPGQMSEYSGYYRLDKQLADCYSTAAGIGIEGQAADKSEGSRGFHWSMAFVPIIVVAVVICSFGVWGRPLVRRLIPVQSEGIVTNAPAPLVIPPPAVIPAPPRPPSPSPVEQVAVSAAAAPAPLPVHGAVLSWGDNIVIDKDVYMTGYSLVGGGDYTVFLSDGSSVRKADGLKSVDKAGCVVGNRFYRMKTLAERLRDEQRSAFTSYRRDERAYDVPVPVRVPVQ